jgi:hypothetical protein
VTLIHRIIDGKELLSCSIAEASESASPASVSHAQIRGAGRVAVGQDGGGGGGGSAGESDSDDDADVKALQRTDSTSFITLQMQVRRRCGHRALCCCACNQCCHAI